jgi:hypothetical protein
LRIEKSPQKGRDIGAHARPLLAKGMASWFGGGRLLTRNVRPPQLALEQVPKKLLDFSDENML